jgi:uncharacterized alkaline shock family protein YloU
MNADDGLTVEPAVVTDVVRLAATELAGVARVGRAGPWWRRVLAGSPIRIRLHDSAVDVRVWVVARSGVSLPGLAAEVRSAIAAAVERLLGLELRNVTVVVDGVVLRPMASRGSASDPGPLEPRPR